LRLFLSSFANSRSSQRPQAEGQAAEEHAMTEEEQIRYDLSNNLVSKMNKLAADHVDLCQTTGMSSTDILTDLGFIYLFLLTQYYQSMNVAPNAAAATFFKFYNERYQERKS
jgi:hypothetical protein